MTRCLSIFAISIVVYLTTGCGTISTRMGDNQFGSPPYGAVVYDAKVIAERQPIAKGLAVLNIPFDLILDTVGLPIDLIFWAFGQEKDGFLSNVQ